MPRNRIRQTEAERREMEARAQTRHQYMARAVSRGLLDYEQRALPRNRSLGDRRYSGIKSLASAALASRSLNAPLCQ